VGTIALCGCAIVSEQTHAYFGAPTYPPTKPAAVQILPAEPSRSHERLGEIILSVEGNPSREKVETKLKQAAAKLGADAVYVVYDKADLFPVIHYDWWNAYWMTQDPHRYIVAVAIKYK
jgi:hypothetical protein